MSIVCSTDWCAERTNQSSKQCSYYYLIHQNCSIIAGVVVQPGGVGSGHIDAAMCAVVSADVAAGVAMIELCTRAVVVAPPGVVDEVATGVIHHGVVNRRIRVPVRGTFRIGRMEGSVGQTPHHRPESRHRRK